MLKNALSITWRYKYLWFFGLFAALLGNGGAFNYGIKNFSKVESQGVWLTNLSESLKSWKFGFGKIDWYGIFTNFDLWGAVLFLLVIVVGLFLLWLSIASQGALVYGIKAAKTQFFNEALRHGSKKFWPLLLVNIILAVAIAVLMAIFNLPFVILYLNTGGNVLWQTVIVILSFIVWVPVTIIFYLIAQYAVIYIVNYDKHIAQAIKDAWLLFAKNWIVSLEAGFLLLLINIITSILLVAVVIVLALPFVMLGLLASALASNGFLWFVIILGILTFIALLFLYGAAWNVFQVSVWIQLFERITGGVVYSKILRWAVALTGGKSAQSGSLSDEQEKK
ncbi:hypothetical protein COZ84_01830 [Candidatus Kuenenbacteria bacterium CG_4_8_14_3_um_filter_39_15]|uniref:Glycerophosphoryl diester phosphodiesterase membrane domain-containing protein n=3 Tax=Candidatus Kueneniibacteriota TaxID=1752740 RepID=A0A2M7ILN3_9BACT|nr:MAG: hypothetical protein COU24_02380 [Candidatus Kuenenbacteria bacterium CG10_big_fil_rev_8_21_14_0_10_39_14]PIW95746.1 MAG: hypothetical protein COZ84_01830 [Candidatus Kuenenbacteria bacterium CG_4_8_14_3_um_filter_39_15]